MIDVIMATPEEIREENRRMRILRILVDLTTVILMQGDVSRQEALDLIQATKQKILQLFPDKEATYDLIYKPRFERLLRQFVWREISTLSDN
jgi:hypothetical protein